MKDIIMSISNDIEHAIKTGKWGAENGKALYDKIAYYSNRAELGEEGFLHFPKDAYRNWPRASGHTRCKYPHHAVVGGRLVISIPGLRAAYARAKQQDVYHGKLKAHLDRHFVDLGLARLENDEIIFEDAVMRSDDAIDNNFHLIETFVESKAEVIEVTDLNTLIKGITDVEELMKWMRTNLSYNDRIAMTSTKYHLLTPDLLIKRGAGVCWDYTELERAWFRKNYPGKFKVFYIVGDAGKVCPSHTFLLYYSATDVAWFEVSWQKHQGIHHYATEEKAISDIARKFRLDNPADRYELRHLADTPTSGMSNQEFMTFADEQSLIPIDGTTLTGTEADYVPVFGIIKSYSQELLRADGSMKDKTEQNSMRFDRILKKLTRGDNYSHALVSLDPSLERMYSFEDGGFEIDGIHDRPSWLGTKSIYVTVMFVTKDERETMQAYLDYLEANIEDTTYGMSNLLTMMVGKPVKQDKRFVCSTITGFILSMGNRKNLQRDYSRLRPEDITILPRAFYVANFSDVLDFDRRKEEFTDKIAELKHDHWEEIDDYNNQLPRLLLKEHFNRLKRIDKIFDWIVDKL